MPGSNLCYIDSEATTRIISWDWSVYELVTKFRFSTLIGPRRVIFNAKGDSIAFVPEVSLIRDSRIEFGNSEANSSSQTLYFDTASHSELMLSPENALLLSWYVDKTVSLWDLNNWKAKVDLSSHSHRIDNIRVGPKSAIVTFCYAEVGVWSPSGENSGEMIPGPQRGSLLAVDGDFLAVVQDPVEQQRYGKIDIWNLRALELAQTLPEIPALGKVALSSTGGFVVFGGVPEPHEQSIMFRNDKSLLGWK
ncbi:hypothetical protein N7478_000460 [Penicillium angulare]|uniref:uncharacterized protein n=1 Tax=Penicillium angulare TaxID=116970 RepID=UPI00254146A6|nr:uncharacterized protein N7478_000460 [Penicillium angulare]KAJ5291209.1 hypothetical protein N7478_000460 [Penicillium angulare]